MLNISSLIRQDSEFRASVDAMRESYAAPLHLPISVNGLSGGAEDAYLVEMVKEARELSGSVVVLVGNDEARDRVCALLSGAGIKALAYKSRDLVFYNIYASHDIARERLSVLYSITRGEADCIVTTPAAALQATMPRSMLKSLSLRVAVGEELAPEALSEKLVALGFSFCDAVEGKGQFSRRGGILDFWGADMDAPTRVEFFGDEIDRIVEFDPITQRSSAGRKEIVLLPVREVIADREARERISREIETLLKNKGLSEEVRDRLQREKGICDSGAELGSLDKYLGLVYEKPECLLSYLEECIIFNTGTAECRQNAEGRLTRLHNDVEGMIAHGTVSKQCCKYMFTLEDYNSFLSANLTIHINAFAGGLGTMRLAGLFGFRSRSTVSYGGNLKMLSEDLVGLCRGLYRVFIISENKQGRDSLADYLREEGFTVSIIPEDGEVDAQGLAGGIIYLAVGSFRGFDLITPKLTLLSMAEDSGRAVMAHRRRTNTLKRVGGGGKRLLSHAELEVGDYVVHASYGIGMFEGVEAVTVDGVTRDYITIRYAGTDKLFVPCDRLENIGKYIGEKDKDGTVKLSRMGGADWQKAKSRAKGAARDIARKLISIYAERQRIPGHAYPPKSELEDEFDACFPFAETDSQLVAIEEIRRDMEKSAPMNRLLCGDVGFGKTEVALRAAFKAILDGKQVALLVPTTILAMQHYQTALARMRGYPVTVEMVSRLRKPKQRREILKRTKEGKVDLLIGTHAIISKDVEFRDLGLLIIDEEQRFGVAQKEKLRDMARNVDTLMLSATPIPRTLNMAMSGISDISVLDEAPGERRPVETYVMEHEDDIIMDAIRRELARKGQVLYLYNRIFDIDRVAAKVSEHIPEARVAYAHGQMEKEELEDIWADLVSGMIDVLVCTTIVETGVDLPNANTLIIENADNFGLSQLHQIRGRVGRSERQAYAYLTFRAGKALGEIAEKRLATIQEFAQFGAGFKIALRDMEIRGAGNLLGAEQHGYIESVGYDLYIKLLNEAIIEERGDKLPERFESTIAINVTAHIPDYYISSSATRMQMYKRIADIATVEDRNDVIDEFVDRFGDMPRAVERLVNVALAKALAERARIKKVELKDNRLAFISDTPRLETWSAVFEKHKGLRFMGIGSPHVIMPIGKGEDACALACNILSAFVNAMD
ncbi:MAG: transcription-repair coupling factor [Clostridia bacterium]|nr:transcription-repair coupling factor [Clostridia bacterium]